MMDWLNNPVRVYVPMAGSRLEHVVDPRSAIVGTPVGEWFEQAEPGWRPEAVVIDYEGNRYGAANMVTHADRCLHAAGRHAKHFPTRARMIVEPDELVLVGSFDGIALTVDEHEALCDWLSLEPGAAFDAELVRS